MIIRPGAPEDLPFLKEMLFEAFFWNPDFDRPAFREFQSNPEFYKLLANWGQPGDAAVIAEVEHKPAGAAWYRLWTEAEHSYGFVDPETPELGIGVHAEQRGKGLGRALLRTLVGTAREAGISALSLSVAPENFARLLYESEGFVKVGESGTSWTLRLELEKCEKG